MWSASDQNVVMRSVTVIGGWQNCVLGRMDTQYVISCHWSYWSCNDMRVTGVPFNCFVCTLFKYWHVSETSPFWSVFQDLLIFLLCSQFCLKEGFLGSSVHIHWMGLKIQMFKEDECIDCWCVQKKRGKATGNDVFQVGCIDMLVVQLSLNWSWEGWIRAVKFSVLLHVWKMCRLLNHLIWYDVMWNWCVNLCHCRIFTKETKLWQSLFPSVGHITVGLTLFPVERSTPGFFNIVFL